jgi:hypothetical protein
VGAGGVGGVVVGAGVGVPEGVGGVGGVVVGAGVGVPEGVGVPVGTAGGVGVPLGTGRSGGSSTSWASDCGDAGTGAPDV